jgi:hypothetical protein
LKNVKDAGAKKHYGFLTKTLQQIEGSVAVATTSYSDSGKILQDNINSENDKALSSMLFSTPF